MSAKSLSEIIRKIGNTFSDAFSNGKRLLYFVPAILSFYPINLAADKQFAYFIHGMNSSYESVVPLERLIIREDSTYISKLKLIGIPTEFPQLGYLDEMLRPGAIMGTALLSYDSKTETVEEAAERLYNEMFPKKSYMPVALIAHSLGGLVARYIAEVINPVERRANIKKVVLIGTPNKGIALLSLSEILVDRIIIKSLFGDAAFDEVDRNSSLMHRLNDDGLNPNISYLVIAGDAREDQLTAAHYKLMDKAYKSKMLRRIYNCGNDGVVPVSSVDIRGLPGWGYNDEFYKLQDNHSGLLTNPRVIREIEKFLRE